MKGTLTLLGSAALCGLAITFSAPTADSEAAASVAKIYEIDASHSAVIFATKHFGVSRFYGRFNDFRGEIEYDADKPTNSSVLVVVNAASVDTNSEGRERHLKSPDFFATNEFPEIIFESTGASKKGEKIALAGKLTLHGVTKEIEATVEPIGVGKDPRNGEALIGYEARFTIDPSDFEIKYMTERPGLLGPEVEMIVSLEARAK